MKAKTKRKEEVEEKGPLECQDEDRKTHDVVTMPYIKGMLDSYDNLLKRFGASDARIATVEHTALVAKERSARVG